MNKGLCPKCKNVIDSKDKICSHCGVSLGIRIINPEKLVGEKEVRKAYPGLYFTYVFLFGGGTVCLLMINVWIGIILILCGFLMMPLYKNKFYELTVERDYALSQKTKNTDKKAFVCPHCSAEVFYGDASCTKCGQKFDWNQI